MKTDYPLHFINSFVNEFQKGKECGDENFIIPPSLFEITKPFISVETPYYKLNEIESKQSLFPLKDKKPIIKIKNHQNNFGGTSATILHGVSFQKLQKMLRPG